jgi:hypothetical protein
MTDPVQTSGGSGPPRRQKRVNRRWATLPSFGWALGLIVTTTVIYGSVLAYQRWTDAAARLEALEYRTSSLAAATPSAATPAGTASPMLTAAQSPPTTTWTAGTWEHEAQRYIRDSLAHATSSGNPPQHRQRNQ